MLPSDEFTSDIFKQILSALADGKNNVVMWGVNETCLHILSLMSSGGFLSHVAAIIDSRTAMQGRTFFGYSVQPPDKVVGIDIDVLVLTSDENKEHFLEEYAGQDNRTPQVIFAGKANYEFSDPIYHSGIATRKRDHAADLSGGTAGGENGRTRPRAEGRPRRGAAGAVRGTGGAGIRSNSPRP